MSAVITTNNSLIRQMLSNIQAQLEEIKRRLNILESTAGFSTTT